MNTSALCTSFLRACIIALTAMVAGPTAQAADETMTLACQGTTISGVEDAKPEPISMGIIVNFTKRTVQGFAYPVKITDVNEVTVAFEGFTIQWSAFGSIDRVTGDVEATSMLTDAKTGKTIASASYALKCRPTQRMF
jgi:hypothetical protein